MRFGICTNAGKLEYIKSIGYDYVEFNLSKIAAMSDEEFNSVLADVNRTEMYAETFNVSFPPELDMVFNVDLNAIRAYCEKAKEEKWLYSTKKY